MATWDMGHVTWDISRYDPMAIQLPSDHIGKCPMYFVQIVPVQMVYVQIVHMCFQHSRCISTGMENKNDLQLLNIVELDVDWRIGFA